MDYKSHVTPIINNQVSYVTLTIILRPYQGIQDTLTELFKTLTLPGKYSSRFVTHNGSHIVVLGIENVEIAPTEVTDEGLESLNWQYHMDGDV